MSIDVVSTIHNGIIVKATNRVADAIATAVRIPYIGWVANLYPRPITSSSRPMTITDNETMSHIVTWAVEDEE